MAAQLAANDSAPAPDEILVATAVNVTWLAGQTKGSAEIEIDFRGLAQTEIPIEVGFACHEVSIARAAAEVLTHFFLLVAREVVAKPEDCLDRVDLGDANNQVVFAIDSGKKAVPDFLLTVQVSRDCDTRAEAAVVAGTRLTKAIDKYLRNGLARRKAALKELDPVKPYFPEILQAAITQTSK
ncbi:MAG: hypothetical protein EXQ85_09870 [Alphaproteobacteria bacterium]|nr:hypothetical protein [Alphaproteobacteria bacterium]